MKKLIELLNEYEKRRIEKINSEGKLFVKLSFRPYTEESLTNKSYRSCWLEICSKYYGFIKWLVDNDKIDFGKVKRVYKNKRVCNITNATIDYIAYGKYESLLMLLSIQDKPIDFLVSVLK